MNRRFCDCFATDLPIVQGAMEGVSGPELVAAVANAGGLGILPVWAHPLPSAQRLIARTRALAAAPFAVNLRADLNQTDHVRLARDEGVELFNLFWGEPGEAAAVITAANCRFIATVGDTRAAQKACDAGASALIVQGVEAGGHVLAERPLEVLLNDILSLEPGIPLIAAGGLAERSDVTRALELGADAVLLGTRFAAAAESDAHPHYKRAILKGEAGSTVRTLCFDGGWPDAPHRVISNSTFRAWEAADRPRGGSRPGETDTILEMPGGAALPRYSAMPPGKEMSGDIEAAALYAGMGLGRVREEQTAKAIIEDLAAAIGTSHSTL